MGTTQGYLPCARLFRESRRGVELTGLPATWQNGGGGGAGGGGGGAEAEPEVVEDELFDDEF